MTFIDRVEVKLLRARYPEGTEIELVYTDDMYTSLRPGDRGVVRYVDDAGTVHISWDNGSSLGMIPGVDSFKKV